MEFSPQELDQQQNIQQTHEVKEQILPPREGIPREILAWLRTLQLPRTVRNPKRDLSNGFLVAMICSRYWSTISMHSYEDKLSISNKKSNWDLLRKHFAINNCPLSDRMIEGMINCREEYANSFLRQLYTQLTGRIVIEIAPLPAEEILLPQNSFIPQTSSHMTSTINVEYNNNKNNNNNNSYSTGKNVEGGEGSSSRVRELPARNFDTLKSNDRIPPAVPTQSRKNIIHAISNNPNNNNNNNIVEGGEGEEGENNENAKPPMGFAVSLRPAEVQQTVVRDITKNRRQKNIPEKQKEQEQEKQQNEKQFDGIYGNYDEASALDLIEEIVRTQSSGQEWSCKCDESISFTEYFLREEVSLGALIQCRVWSSLLSNVNNIVERVLRQGSSILSITELFLKNPPLNNNNNNNKMKEQEQYKQLKRQSHNSQRLSSGGNSTIDSWRRQTTIDIQSIPQRYIFIASLLANISDMDAFLAVSMYCDDVLPFIKTAMRILDYSNTENYASLFCAAVPADRKLASKLLSNMLSTVYDTITASGGIESRRSFYLFLRSILLRLVRNNRRTSLPQMRRSSHSDTGNSILSSATSPTGQTLSLTKTILVENDLLSNGLFVIVGYNIVAALTHESINVRLVGVYLAEALAYTGGPLEILFGTILPLLCSCIKTASPIFNCICSAWLRAVLKRINGPLGEKLILGKINEENLCSQAIPHLAAMICYFCSLLQSPLQLNMRIYIAEQLALCLDDIPNTDDIRQLFNSDELALRILAVLQEAPTELVSSFLSPPPISSSLSSSSFSPSDSRIRGQLIGRLGYHTTLNLNNSLLGPLRVNGSLRDCYPLFLSEAIIIIPLQEGTITSSLVGENGGNISNTNVMNDGIMNINNTNNNLGGNVVTSRQILAKANSILHDRMIPEEISNRVTWLYKINVACRSECNFPDPPITLTESDVMQRWNIVMKQMYRDIAVITAAAEIMFSNKSNLTENIVNKIAQMAGMAQQIVLKWYTELRKDNASIQVKLNSNNSINMSSASVTPFDSGEKLKEAMQWYHKTFGELTGGEQQQQQQQQQKQQKLSSVSPSRNVNRKYSNKV